MSQTHVASKFIRGNAGGREREKGTLHARKSVYQKEEFGKVVAGGIKGIPQSEWLACQILSVMVIPLLFIVNIFDCSIHPRIQTL